MTILDYSAYFIVILLALGFHEYAHAKMADLAGDPTPRIFGRVTLNPFKHLDPMGTIMIVLTTLSGFGIGWGKPVYVDPQKMKNPKWDHFWSVAAGPISNLIQASIFAFILRGCALLHFFPGEFVFNILQYGILINLGVCFFNLIPLGPLDGHWLVGALLSEKARIKWCRWNATTGSFVLLALILIGQMNPRLSIIGSIVRPFVVNTAQFFLGR